MRKHSTMLLFQLGAVVSLLWVLTLPAGCKTDSLASEKIERPPGPMTSLENPAGANLPEISIAGRDELDIVEELVMHRTQYARLLRALVIYYNEHGMSDKAMWARSELADLQRVKPYDYIAEAATPVETLRPKDSIPEANKLFEEGMALLKEGGHGTPIFYNQEIMKKALAKFKELVEKYPTSDKIAQAAFYIGEIHKEYFEEKDNDIALLWYKRAIDWDPNIQLPARFQMAAVWDYRLHNRDKALYWYQEAIEKEQFNRSNVLWAKSRIRELTPARVETQPTEEER
ncbi:MAG TPA: hypothetical protein PLL20_15355 [Phycisphaerae bacterium]|nr:hypothetical protein [Phycisphaerae bacterium]HRR86197.1 hypothetical protein [Phycisphaerae bacterium]